MRQSISVNQFIEVNSDQLIIDVRSPAEFCWAHIPGAINLPLFTDEERAAVGTAYKQESRETAIKLGLDFFGPNMRRMVEKAEQLLQEKFALTEIDPAKHTLHLYCWRGGMRSAGVAWLMSLYGFKVFTLDGGYKAFRNFILQQFEREDMNIQLLGGYTGSGKTEKLLEMSHQGESVIDLEGIACHKGSAFGNLGMPDQPTQEMFENILGIKLFSLVQTKQVIWMEDESQRLGHVNIPAALWNNMLHAPVHMMERSFDERLDRIVHEYGQHNTERLINATLRIQKRLGGLCTKNTITNLQQGNIKEAFRILLQYYDKQYDKSISKKLPVSR